MESTPLHHKPILYGSRLADAIFFVAVVLHVLPAVAAPASAIVALAARKGKRVHLAAGRVFVRSMLLVALTGVGLDLVRLFIHYGPNHTKYATTTDPSTIPARLAFLYAALCVCYLLYEVTPPRVWRGRRDDAPRLRIPLALTAAAIAFTLLIVLRYNPWTGALGMIASLAVAVVVTARTPGGVPRHRVGMVLLALFSWWGALQGFIPALVYAIGGVDPSTTPYVGDRPGPFTPTFFGIVLGWAIIGAIGALLIRRFSGRAMRGAATTRSPRPSS